MQVLQYALTTSCNLQYHVVAGKALSCLANRLTGHVCRPQSSPDWLLVAGAPELAVIWPPPAAAGAAAAVVEPFAAVSAAALLPGSRLLGPGCSSSSAGGAAAAAPALIHTLAPAHTSRRALSSMEANCSSTSVSCSVKLQEEIGVVVCGKGVGQKHGLRRGFYIDHRRSDDCCHRVCTMDC